MIVGTAFVLFLVFITARGELPDYLAVFGLGGNKTTATSTKTSSTNPVTGAVSTVTDTVSTVTGAVNQVNTAYSAVTDLFGSDFSGGVA